MSNRRVSSPPAGPRSGARFRRPRFITLAAVFTVAIAGFAASTVTVAQQDVAEILFLNFDDGTRWSVSLAEGPGGETRLIGEGALGDVAASSVTVTAGGGTIVVDGIDPIETGSIARPGEIEPDEDRIDRSWKGDLPATITTPATAPGFSAGSVFKEHSRLAPPDEMALPTVAFEDATVPLSVLAVARFISPARERGTEVADLGPAPLPRSRPDVTTLTAAYYPERTIVPSAANAAAPAMLAAYAPDASVVDQDVFAALFTTPKTRPETLTDPTSPGDHWWARLLLPAAIYSAKEQKCLAEAVYFEARSEPYKGQVAVAQVVLNRVRNPAYPGTVCKVVYQNRTVANACQFSFACDGIRDVVRDRRAFALARKVARDVSFEGVRVAEVGSATHYHATYVRPVWASVFTRKARIGKHVFYQTINGGWS